MIQFNLDEPKPTPPPRRYDDYDTAEGIFYHYLSRGLVGLNALERDRHRAGYDRHEDLHRFILLGRWYADSAGNLGLITQPKEGLGPCRVMPVEFMNPDAHWTSSMGSHLPPAEVVCAQCGKGWELDNAHDCYVAQTDSHRDATPWVGQTLLVAREALKNEHAHARQWVRDDHIRHDRFIDLSHDLYDWGDQKGKPHEWPRNEKGWEDLWYAAALQQRGAKFPLDTPPADMKKMLQAQRQALREAEATPLKPEEVYLLEPGDELSVDVWTYYHGQCHREKQADDHRQYFTEIFQAAGFTNFVLEDIPNEYCPCEVCGPWFLLRQSGRGRRGKRVLKIGWRKRVINIDWTEYTSNPELLARFKDEDVTKWETGIHAWGKDKAIAYLTTIREVANA